MNTRNTRLTVALAVVVIATALVLIWSGLGDDEESSFDVLAGLEVLNGRMPPMHELAARPSIIVTWTTWCPACVQELAFLRENYPQLQGRINLVAVNLTSNERDVNAVREFLEGVDLPFVVLGDPDNIAGRHFQSRYIPANFLLDTSGNILQLHEGPLTMAIIERWLHDNP